MTSEQGRAFELFRETVEPLRLKVVSNDEGWPMVPCQRGRIEWYCDGKECASGESRHSCPIPGKLALAVFTTTRGLPKRLLALPGVKPYQVGDREFRAVFLPENLAAVAQTIGARQRYRLSEAGRQAKASTREARVAALAKARAAKRQKVEADAGAA
jgi:hypothetical protein